LRLGRIKALERINSQSLIERTIEYLSPPTQSVLVVTSEEQFGIIRAARLKAKTVVDLYPGKGALGGIYTGLVSADTYYTLVVGCDMPFLNRDLLRYIIDQISYFDTVVPKVNGMLEPLHAIYSKGCLAAIREMMEKNRLEISHLFGLVKTRYIGEEELDEFDSRHLSFFNINTLADLKKARKLIEKEEHCLTVAKDSISCD
jgi:molybdopterin-guanine dinucleotide biosynthesis protein A